MDYTEFPRYLVRNSPYQPTVQTTSESSSADNHGAVAANPAGEVAVGGNHRGRRRIIHVGYLFGDAVIGGVGAAAGGVSQFHGALATGWKAGRGRSAEGR